MNKLYEIFPKVFPVSKPARITIRPGRSRKFPENNQVIHVKIHSMENHADQIELSCKPDRQGALHIKTTLKNKGEYRLELRSKQGSKHPLGVMNIFAAAKKYARLRPYRGDLHIHTTYSDGKSSPIEMAIIAREKGLDYAAITDHCTYAPSLEAIKQAGKAGLNMLLLPGEEVGMQNWHMLSINASEAIMNHFSFVKNVYEPAYQKALSKLRKRKLLPGVSLESYAHVVATVERIQKLGGLSCINHPYWVFHGRFHLPTPLFKQILHDNLTDCVEVLVSDIRTEDQMLTVNHYFQARQAGCTISPIANSDAHAAKTLGLFHTVTFAPDRTPQNILAAIKAGQTVACMQLPENKLLCVSDADLVKLTYFLEREFFPLHNELCQAEAKAVRRKDRAALKLLRQEYRDIYKKYWAK